MDRAMLTFDLEAGIFPYAYSLIGYHFADLISACGTRTDLNFACYRSDQRIRLECQTNIRLRDRKLQYPVQCQSKLNP